MSYVLNTHANITPYIYDTSPVPSDYNEPCFAPNLTFAPDPDLDPHTDSLIPRIDAIADNVRVRDFAQESHQVQEVKIEPELEEGEIMYNALNTILTRAAQD
ncbi:hypothetical protein EV702DRAFT_1204301 [Suillus placidus]|uniref:Uncharacterized protein n=1 Tax=Suillus placidus TaxID=48579 RepID=A0A9P7CW99_9AGAM|nr:hypothetical protein EV702DRAFT_1204301 [Suillus placidus]